MLIEMTEQQKKDLRDDELRKTVGDSFNIYQASVAMCSIFMGFVFAALLLLLSKEKPLTSGEQAATWALVAALSFLLTGLLNFALTAIQVVEYWGIFFPESKARIRGSILFQLGIVAMLVSIALMLASKAMPLLSGIVVLESALLWLVVFRIGRHPRGPGTRQVD